MKAHAAEFARIAVEEDAAGAHADGRLTLTWDGRRYFVPIRVAW